MNNLILFLNAFLSYAFAFVVVIALIIVAMPDRDQFEKKEECGGRDRNGGKGSICFIAGFTQNRNVTDVCGKY